MGIQLDSGTIQSAARRLEVLGNNISNVNTSGFKSSNFEEVLGSAISSGVASKKPGVVQSFAQGNVTASSNALDMAINGNGMFQLESNGAKVYTRNGQFSLDKSGDVVNSSGDNLMGYAADVNGKVLSGKAVKLHINTADSAPMASTKATVGVTLDSRKPVIDTTATPFNPADPSTYTHSTTTTIYDAKGESHDVQTFYIKTAVAGTPPSIGWDVKATVSNDPTNAANTITNTDGTTSLNILNLASLTSTPPGQLVFDTSGKLTQAVPPTVPLNGMFSITVGVPPVGATVPQTVALDLSSTVQYGTSFAATMSQDGTPIGQMTGYRVGGDGVINAQYSNGKSMVMGQVILAKFASMNGLVPTASNQWLETAASGIATLGTPGSAGIGELQSLATEDSNVDLTVEMIKMISAQRAFQAASEVIKKQDQILQTAVSIAQ